MRDKIRKKNPENHIVGFLKNLLANYGGKKDVLGQVQYQRVHQMIQKISALLFSLYLAKVKSGNVSVKDLRQANTHLYKSL